MEARYEQGISIAEVTETFPRMLPEQFPQVREVVLPGLGDGVLVNVLVECDGEVVRANAFSWLPFRRANRMTHYVPSIADDRIAQEKALQLI